MTAKCSLLSHTPPKIRFFFADFFKAPGGGPGTARLQCLPLLVISCPRFLDRPAVETFPVGVAGNPDNAKVHPDEAGWLDGGRRRRVDDKEEVKHPVPKHQVGLPVGSAELDFLVFAHLHGDGHPAFDRQDAGLFQTLKAKHALVVGNRPVGLERALDGRVPPVCADHFMDGKYGHLGGQAELRPNRVVCEFLQCELGNALLAVRNLGDEATRIVKHLHGVQQRGVLGSVWDELYLQRDFHIEHFTQ